MKSYWVSFFLNQFHVYIRRWKIQAHLLIVPCLQDGGDFILARINSKYAHCSSASCNHFKLQNLSSCNFIFCNPVTSCQVQLLSSIVCSGKLSLWGNTPSPRRNIIYIYIFFFEDRPPTRNCASLFTRAKTRSSASASPGKCPASADVT